MATPTTDIVQKKSDTLQSLLEANKSQIEAALPRHLTVDRLMRIALTEARKNPVLLECTQSSFLGAIIQAAQLGLEPGGALGHCYLVPFKNNKTNTREVQFIVGYRGMMALAYRSPLVDHVIARAVYDTDKFSFQMGTEERVEHIPDLEANGKNLTHVYAVVFLKGGGKVFDVMEAKEIEAARARSKSADSGPWETDYVAMAMKSVVRRMFKYTPVSIELQTAVGMDEAGERGEQGNGDFIETTGARMPETDRAKKLDAIMSGSQDHAPEEPKAAATPEVLPKGPMNAKAEPKKEMGRIDLGKALNVAARRLGVQIQDYCHQSFGKDTKDLSLNEMTALHQAILEDCAKEGK